MSRLASASKALRGPFRKLVRKLELPLRKPLIRKKAKGISPAASKAAIPTPRALANEVAEATGGVVRRNKGGFTVDIPNGRRGIVLRVMEDGGRRSHYYRIGVEGKAVYTAAGEASTLRALTHINIESSSLDDILRIVARIKKGA
jgi:hypothetical protein